MQEKFDVIIVGAGPGGLATAQILAQGGARVLVLERKNTVGRKVCAGGITWEGLIMKVPKNLIERTFPVQHIYSNWQKVTYRRKDPVIATVNRERLGRWMMGQAVDAGADVRKGCNVREIKAGSVTVTGSSGNPFTVRFDHLVGADGSSSAVRRFLNIPSIRMGVGMNFQVPGRYEDMEWHLNTKLFGNGYGWIFPHQETVSIGAYRPQRGIPPIRFKKRLLQWAEAKGFQPNQVQAQAELINFDYRGFRFGNIWLVGDAAGLASGLTGEGINPAIVSGRTVAGMILDSEYPAWDITVLARKQHRHREIVDLAAVNKTLCTLLMETLVALLRLRIVDFQKQLAM